MDDGDQSQGKDERRSRSLAPFRPHSGSESVVVQLDAPEILADLRGAYDALAVIHQRISCSNWFTFLDKSDFGRLRAQGEQLEAEFLWRQVHQLLILVARSSCFGACSLIDGITWSLGTVNELTLALT